MEFVVKKIVRVESDIGDPQKDCKWTALLEAPETKLTIISKEEFEFGVGDEAKFEITTRQTKIGDKNAKEE